MNINKPSSCSNYMLTDECDLEPDSQKSYQDIDFDFDWLDEEIVYCPEDIDKMLRCTE